MLRAFSYCYSHIAALLPCEQYSLCPFLYTLIRQLLCLMTLEATKLAQVGFGDFLADSGVSRLKGNVTIIKRCILFSQFVTVPGTNKLIVNIKV